MNENAKSPRENQEDASKQKQEPGLELQPTAADDPTYLNLTDDDDDEDGTYGYENISENDLRRGRKLPPKPKQNRT